MEAYSERKNAFEKTQFWTIENGFLIKKQEDKMDQIVELKNIKSIQLFYKPHRYRTYNYACRIVTENGLKLEILSTSYESFGDFKNQAETYNPFIQNIVSQTFKKNNRCKIFTGLTVKSFLIQYLLTFLILWAVTSLLSAFGSGGQMFRLLVMAFYLYYIIVGFKKNFPKEIYDGKIPEKVLPTL